MFRAENNVNFKLMFIRYDDETKNSCSNQEITVFLGSIFSKGKTLLCISFARKTFHGPKTSHYEKKGKYNVCATQLTVRILLA
jgi:hypothetical protein